MPTKIRTSQVTNTQLAVAVIAVFMAGGLAFAVVPKDGSIERQNYSKRVRHPQEKIVEKQVGTKKICLLNKTSSQKKVNTKIVSPEKNSSKKSIYGNSKTSSVYGTDVTYSACCRDGFICAGPNGMCLKELDYTTDGALLCDTSGDLEECGQIGNQNFNKWIGEYSYKSLLAPVEFDNSFGKLLVCSEQGWHKEVAIIITRFDSVGNREPPAVDFLGNGEIFISSVRDGILEKIRQFQIKLSEGTLLASTPPHQLENRKNFASFPRNKNIHTEESVFEYRGEEYRGIKITLSEQYFFSAMNYHDRVPASEYYGIAKQKVLFVNLSNDDFTYAIGDGETMSVLSSNDSWMIKFNGIRKPDVLEVTLRADVILDSATFGQVEGSQIQALIRSLDKYVYERAGVHVLLGNSSRSDIDSPEEFQNVFQHKKELGGEAPDILISLVDFEKVYTDNNRDQEELNLHGLSFVDQWPEACNPIPPTQGAGFVIHISLNFDNFLKITGEESYVFSQPFASVAFHEILHAYNGGSHTGDAECIRNIGRQQRYSHHEENYYSHYTHGVCFLAFMDFMERRVICRER